MHRLKNQNESRGLSCLELDFSSLQGLGIGLNDSFLQFKVSFISVHIDFHGKRSESID